MPSNRSKADGSKAVWKRLLTLIGIAASIGGFYLDHADSSTLKALVPQYATVRRGIDQIQQSGRLLPTDPDFPVLATIIASDLEQEGPKDIPRPVIVERLERGFGGLSFSATAPATPTLGLHIFVKGQASAVPADLLIISNAIDSRAREVLAHYGVIVFWAGMIVTIVTSLVLV